MCYINRKVRFYRAEAMVYHVMEIISQMLFITDKQLTLNLATFTQDPAHLLPKRSPAAIDLDRSLVSKD